MSDTLWPHGLYPARLLCPWDFPSKNTVVVYHFFLQGIFQEISCVSYIGRWSLYCWNTREAPHFDANIKQTVWLFWKYPRPEFLSCNSIRCIARCHVAVFASTSGNKGLTNWWKTHTHTQVNILYTAIVVSSTLSLTQNIMSQHLQNHGRPLKVSRVKSQTL